MFKQTIDWKSKSWNERWWFGYFRNLLFDFNQYFFLFVICLECNFGRGKIYNEMTEHLFCILLSVLHEWLKLMHFSLANCFSFSFESSHVVKLSKAHGCQPVLQSQRIQRLPRSIFQSKIPRSTNQSIN